MTRTAQIVLMCSLAAGMSAAQNIRGSAEREIVDPSSGARWLLVRDASHPGGPGRLVAAGSAPPRGQIAICAGEAVLVEEHNDRVDLRLQGVALAPAEAGENLSVRLRTSGKVVQVRAIAPGRTELAHARSWR